MIGRNTVILATAHPSKFLEALKLSLPEHLIPRPPEEMQMLFHLPQRKTLIPPQLEEIENFIRATIN
jgi:threonine synthase